MPENSRISWDLCYSLWLWLLLTYSAPPIADMSTLGFNMYALKNITFISFDKPYQDTASMLIRSNVKFCCSVLKVWHWAQMYVYVRFTRIWMVNVPLVPGLHLWWVVQVGAQNTTGSIRMRAGLMHERSGRGEQGWIEKECRLFPCVRRTGEPSWLQAGAVSP